VTAGHGVHKVTLRVTAKDGTSAPYFSTLRVG
jgi:hypothetical protein